MNFPLLFLMVLLQSLMLYAFVTWGLAQAIVTGLVVWSVSYVGHEYGRG